MKVVHRDGIDYEDLSLGQWLLKVIADPWKNSLLPAAVLRMLTRTSKSQLIAESHRAPGGWLSMEVIYQNNSPVDLLDKMAVRDNPISMAARNRRKFVVSELARHMQSFATERVINVLGVGAGPGLQVQDAFLDTGMPAGKLNAVFFDLDESAFKYGTNKAREAGLGRSVTYMRGDARKIQYLMPDCQFHIAKLVGIIEYIPDEAVIELARCIREVMHPMGTLITHGIQDPHKAMPFLERVFHLKHIQRSGEQVQALLTQAGFQNFSRTMLPLNVYEMVSATPELPVSVADSFEQAA